nr:hypothetical protein 2 [bacterium]
MAIHDGGINRVIALLDPDLSHIAVGSGTVPSTSAAQLSSETYRKDVGTTFIDGNILIKEVYFDETEANGTISELAIFCNGANDNIGTGEIYASSGANITKDNTQSLTISFEIEVKEASI